MPKLDNQDKVPILGKDPILSPAGAEARVSPAAGAGITAGALLAASRAGTAAATVAWSWG